MTEQILTIEENRPLASRVYIMQVRGEQPVDTAPGQFVNLQIPGFFLRRPISVCDARGDRMTLIYKTVGRGTEAMTGMKPGDTLPALTGLGNGFTLSRAGNAPVLIGGGVGVPPLYYLARKLREQGTEVCAVLGFNTDAEVFFEKEFRSLGCRVLLATADGSRGTRGFVTDALPETSSFFYACGPLPMLKAVCACARTEGEVSLEERMGCGFGACMGCTWKMKSGNRRICRDGPVFDGRDVLWEG